MFPPNAAAPKAGARKDGEEEGGSGPEMTTGAGLGRGGQSVPFTSLILVWGVGAAHQPVLGVPIIGVAIFGVVDMKPQRVGIAHHGLGWGQKRHQG